MNAVFKTAILIFGLSPLYTSASYAGFEFSGKTPHVPNQVEKNMADAVESPMAIVPIPQVQNASEPGNLSGEEVYIKRGQKISISPAENEAINTKGLLNAVEQGGEIGHSPKQDETITWNVAPIGTDKLVINPYPLQDQASHSHIGQSAFVDQAMMEQTGLLRPVMTPGKNKTMAMVDRSSRINGNQGLGPKISAYENISAANVPVKVESMKLTPIPGGEAAPIKSMIRVEGRVSKEIPDESSAIVKTTPDKKPFIDSQTPVAQTKEIPSANALPKFADAAGFGRDLPLALALSQVVPAGYSYVFDQSVNTGALVTWKGGKPWNEVLNDMLVKSGMVADIQNNQVVIKNQKS